MNLCQIFNIYNGQHTYYGKDPWVLNGQTLNNSKNWKWNISGQNMYRNSMLIPPPSDQS